MKFKKIYFICLFLSVLIISPVINLNHNKNTSIQAWATVSAPSNSNKNKVAAKAEQKQAQVPENKENFAQKNTDKSIFSKIMKFLPVLIGIILFLYIFKVIRNILSLKNTGKPDYENIVYQKDPETMSEAVCSFVKHRLKYK